jgi:uncharacterized membrane protein
VDGHQYHRYRFSGGATGILLALPTMVAEQQLYMDHDPDACYCCYPVSVRKEENWKKFSFKNIVHILGYTCMLVAVHNDVIQPG